MQKIQLMQKEIACCALKKKKKKKKEEVQQFPSMFDDKMTLRADSPF